MIPFVLTRTHIFLKSQSVIYYVFISSTVTARKGREGKKRNECQMFQTVQKVCGNDLSDIKLNFHLINIFSVARRKLDTEITLECVD